MIPGFTRRQKSDTMSFAAMSISKKYSIFVVKRLEILNIQPKFAVSPFLRSNHFFVVAVAGQIPTTTSTGDGSKACLEQAISRLQATPLSKKFEKIRNFNGGRYTMKRISKSMFRGAIAQPTSFKLCRMVQTYILGMEPQAMMP